MALTDDDKQWISDALEGLETRLLRGFEGWVNQITQTSKSQTARQRELDEKLDVAISRIDELEKWRRELRGGGPK